jgi:hypothetical protein
LDKYQNKGLAQHGMTNRTSRICPKGDSHGLLWSRAKKAGSELELEGSAQPAI